MYPIDHGSYIIRQRCQMQRNCAQKRIRDVAGNIKHIIIVQSQNRQKSRSDGCFVQIIHSLQELRRQGKYGKRHFSILGKREEIKKKRKKYIKKTKKDHVKLVGDYQTSYEKKSGVFVGVIRNARVRRSEINVERTSGSEKSKSMLRRLLSLLLDRRGMKMRSFFRFWNSMVKY